MARRDRHDPREADDRTHELAETMLAEVGGEIDRADQKASLLIGSVSIAFSIVLSGMLTGDWTLDSLNPAGIALWALGIAAAAGSVITAAMAVWPRLSRAPGRGAISYWGQVHSLGSGAEVGAALAERGLHPPERTYQQLLALSTVVYRKYRHIRWSMVLAAIGIMSLIVSFVFVA